MGHSERAQASRRSIPGPYTSANRPVGGSPVGHGPLEIGRNRLVKGWDFSANGMPRHRSSRVEASASSTRFMDFKSRVQHWRLQGVEVPHAFQELRGDVEPLRPSELHMPHVQRVVQVAALGQLGHERQAALFQAGAH